MTSDWFRPLAPGTGKPFGESQFRVASDSFFFSGHFPGNPVLPGIAMLAMVRETVRQALPAAGAVPHGFRRVRFRSLVEGATTCMVRVGASDSSSTAGTPFEVWAGEHVAADGLLADTPCGTLQLPAFGEGAVVPEEPIERFLPHRDRMRVASLIIRVQPGLCEVAGNVLPSWPLVSDGGADSVVLLELLAQTAAAMTGWEERDTPGGGGRGFLVGSRFFTSRDAVIPVGTRSRSVVHSLRQRDNYRVFQGQVFGPDGAVLAEAELQAFRP